MPGNKIGGAKAAKTNKEKWGEDFYKRIGSLGGKASTTGGFFANRELAREAGRKGGLKSRRTKKLVDIGYEEVSPDFTHKERKPSLVERIIGRG